MKLNGLHKLFFIYIMLAIPVSGYSEENTQACIDNLTKKGESKSSAFKLCKEAPEVRECYFSMNSMGLGANKSLKYCKESKAVQSLHNTAEFKECLEKLDEKGSVGIISSVEICASSQMSDKGTRECVLKLSDTMLDAGKYFLSKCLHKNLRENLDKVLACYSKDIKGLNKDMSSTVWRECLKSNSVRIPRKKKMFDKL